jgi:acetamidase/formamidase
MNRKLLFCMVVTLLCCCLIGGNAMAAGKVHKFVATPENVHNGMLESTIPPALTINSGDTVVFNSLMLLEGKLKGGMTIDEILALRKEVLDRGNGAYALTGPFFVNGAEPGDVLEIRIKKIVPGDYGITYNYPGDMKRGALPEYVTEGWSKTLYYSKDKKTAEFMPGIVIPLKPFFGTMALSPRPGEKKNSAVPDYFAGNMDNKELVAGTTLFVPVSAKGALFMAGDAHGAQGDGEVSITAIETYIKEAVFQFIVRKDMKLERPMAETPTHWILTSYHPSLDEALKIALKDAIDFLVAKKGLTKNEAYALCSLAVDFRITQVVDGNKGVHAMIPKSIFKK